MTGGGQSELRGEGVAHYRVVPGAVDVLCETPNGRLTVPLNGVAASVFFAGIGLPLTLVLGITYRGAVSRGSWWVQSDRSGPWLR